MPLPDARHSTLGAGLSFGYRLGLACWRIAIFEPNIYMVKTSIIPILIVEEAYRMTPHFLECLRVCNTLHMKKHATFVHFSNQLDIVSCGIATFEGRYAAYEFMAAHGDAAVSHRWESG